MTTLLGLNHIRDGAGTLRELRRVAQRLLAVHQVFEPGTANDQAIVELGFADLAYATTYRDTLMAAGWRPEVRFERRVTARPTPRGVLLEGLQIDALPVEPVDVSILLIDAH
jgi:hypothetical protein